MLNINWEIKQKKQDYILMGLFCGHFVREALPYRSSQKHFRSVYIFIYGLYEITDW